MTDYATVFRGQTILVVGGAGFVGSNLVHALLETKPESLWIVDNLLSAERCNVPDHPDVTFVEGSITDDAVLHSLPENLHYVFHLATYHGNQSSIANPLADHENNTLTTLKLFERIHGFQGLGKVVYASAGCTVAQKTDDTPRPTTEADPVSLHLDSPYQISKIIGEFYANYYFRRHGLPVVKARFQNVYGPREILGAGQWRGTPATVWRNVVPTFVYRGLKSMPLILENEGVATRDFIFVDDLVEGLLRCASIGQAGEVYNLASGVETSIRDLAGLVNELTENPTPPKIAPRRNWDRSGRRFGSTDKARDELDFQACTSIGEGLRTTVEWSRRHLELIDQTIARHADRMGP